MKNISKSLLYVIIFLPALVKGVSSILLPKNPIGDYVVLFIYIAFWLYAAGSLWDNKKYQNLFGPNISHSTAMFAVFVGLIMILIYAFFIFALYYSPIN